jgi:shikimate dehydrogenase
MTSLPITGKTQLLGVIGYPIAHSLSPVMHNQAIAALGVDAVYVAFPITPANLSAALAGLAAVGTIGLSVTIPHKQAVMPLLVEISDQARAVGAVNTLWQTDRGWAGTNTDVDGFMAPLQALRSSWQGSTMVVLGSGGAARATIASARLLGCDRVVVIGRDPAKLAALQRDFAPPNPLAIALEVAGWDDADRWLPQADLLVNATPVGMPPRADELPLSIDQLALLPPSVIAYDLIYTPRPTRFLQAAADRGLQAIDGLEMLVQQGAVALTRWLDRPAPADIMRAALEQFLQHH